MTHPTVMLLNLIYLILLLLISPWLIYKAIATGKYRTGLIQKFFGAVPPRTSDRPCVWFHAVSVGEVILLKNLISQFRAAHPGYACILTTTTNTGYDVAQRNYSDIPIHYFPLDFTWAVKRFLNNIRPDLLVLAELELWPNLISIAHARGCRIAIVNGRISPKSYRGYRRIRPLMRRLLNKLDVIAVQNEQYAQRALDIGAVHDKVRVTGSLKYDGVTTDRNNEKTAQLGRTMGLKDDDLVWIVGSTQEPEEELAIEIYQRIKPQFPALRMILVPRHKERFEDVAQLLQQSGQPFVRRSQIRKPVSNNSGQPIILLDTLGELSALWGLADLAYVGGSLSNRGGQNMIEPAAYGAAVTFGPNVWNFQQTADALLMHDAAVQVSDANEWEAKTIELLNDDAKRKEIGLAAQRFVLTQQGATSKTLDLVFFAGVPPSGSSSRRAA